VPSRVKMELMGDFERCERLLQFARASVEAVPVFRAAIEIDFSFRKQGGVFLCEHEGTIQIKDEAAIVGAHLHRSNRTSQETNHLRAYGIFTTLA